MKNEKEKKIVDDEEDKKKGRGGEKAQDERRNTSTGTVLLLSNATQHSTELCPLPLPPSILLYQHLTLPVTCASVEYSPNTH